MKQIYKSKKIFTIIASISFVSSVIIELLLTPFLQWIIVRPRELSLQTPYIARSIKATRRAYQLDSIKTELINPREKLSRKDLELGESTLRNIRLWDNRN